LKTLKSEQIEIAVIRDGEGFKIPEIQGSEGFEIAGDCTGDSEGQSRLQGDGYSKGDSRKQGIRQQGLVIAGHQK